jgi:hypothetical protein
LADEVRRELGRVADRLRVLGPRWAQRQSTPSEVAHVRAALQRLADLAATGVPTETRRVPELGLHALSDQLLVLGHEALAEADADALADVHAVLVDLRRTL